MVVFSIPVQDKARVPPTHGRSCMSVALVQAVVHAEIGDATLLTRLFSLHPAKKAIIDCRQCGNTT
jgi:hypothetical protein